MNKSNLLDKKHYEDVFKKYICSEYFFPLISMVLEKKQEGIVFTNNNDKPTTFLIIHKFGFAQFFQIKEDKAFDELVINYLTNKKKRDKTNNIDKIRLYCPDSKWEHIFDELKLDHIAKTKRVRLIFNKKMSTSRLKKDDYLISPINRTNIDIINQCFELDLCKRFWTSCDDAIENSNALVLSDHNRFLSICYAAAISNKFAEIDISTNNNYRKQGFALLVLEAFIAQCKQNNIIPLWDCYKNNLPSYNLAIKMNFKPKFEYNFYIIDLLES